jgi:hypothetical protein
MSKDTPLAPLSVRLKLDNVQEWLEKTHSVLSAQVKREYISFLKNEKPWALKPYCEAELNLPGEITQTQKDKAIANYIGSRAKEQEYVISTLYPKITAVMIDSLSEEVKTNLKGHKDYSLWNGDDLESTQHGEDPQKLLKMLLDVTRRNRFADNPILQAMDNLEQKRKLLSIKQKDKESLAQYKQRFEYQTRDAQMCGIQKLSGEEEVMVFIQGMTPRSRARKHMETMLENSNQMIESFPKTVQDVWNEVYTMESASTGGDTYNIPESHIKPARSNHSNSSNNRRRNQNRKPAHEDVTTTPTNRHEYRPSGQDTSVHCIDAGDFEELDLQSYDKDLEQAQILDALNVFAAEDEAIAAEHAREVKKELIEIFGEDEDNNSDNSSVPSLYEDSEEEAKYCGTKRSRFDELEDVEERRYLAKNTYEQWYNWSNSSEFTICTFTKMDPDFKHDFVHPTYLQVKESPMRCIGDDLKMKSIGEGLFTTVDITAGQPIGTFFGQEVASEAFESMSFERRQYAIRLDENTILDCYQDAMGADHRRKICSKANCPVDLYDRVNDVTLDESYANAAAAIGTDDRGNKHVLLYAIADIEKGSEVLWVYNNLQHDSDSDSASINKDKFATIAVISTQDIDKTCNQEYNLDQDFEYNSLVFEAFYNEYMGLPVKDRAVVKARCLKQPKSVYWWNRIIANDVWYFGDCELLTAVKKECRTVPDEDADRGATADGHIYGIDAYINQPIPPDDPPNRLNHHIEHYKSAIQFATSVQAATASNVAKVVDTTVNTLTNSACYSFSSSKSIDKLKNVEKCYVLLDSQAGVSIFKTRSLLHNILPNDIAITLMGVNKNAPIQVREAGQYSEFGLVLYSAQSSENILSMAEMVDRKYDVRYYTRTDEFTLTSKDSGIRLRFTRYGPHYKCALWAYSGQCVKPHIRAEKSQHISDTNVVHTKAKHNKHVKR